MTSVALGAAAACLASTFYNLGVALQASEARHAPADASLRPSLAAFLLRRRRWLAGTALGVVGWPLQMAALVLAPLAVVQPALAFGLVLLLFVGARALHEPVGVREVAGVAMIVLGVAGLAVVAPGTSRNHAGAGSLALALAALGAVALLPYVRRGRRGGGPVAAAVAAGAAFAWSGLSTKFVADALAAHAMLAALAWTAATGAASGLALVSEMTALQRMPASRAAPLVFVVQVAIPVLAAPLLTGESWGRAPLGRMGTVAGVAVVMSGAVLLTTARAVRAFVDASSDDSGTSDRPPDRGEVTAAPRAGPAPSTLTRTLSPATGTARPGPDGPATGEASMLRARRY
jgi:drug/metabolite transporter (DMT)-like permease